MNKRLIAFLPILSLFLSLPLIPVNAAVKAGGTCSKAGITFVVSGKTYTCIKSGKKLVWNKGVAVAVSTGAPGNTNQPGGAQQPGGTTSSAKEPWYFAWNYDAPTAAPRNPPCTDQYPLRQNPAAITSYTSLNRLGYTQPGAHAMPVPHHNIATQSLRGTGRTDENGHLLVSERVDPIASPADLTIIALSRNIYSRNVSTNEDYSYEEWMITAHVCGTKYISFLHIDDVPSSWLTAIKAPGVRKECNTGQDNASGCMYTYLSIPLKQGARLGRSSGRSHGWDIGGWDTSRPTPGVMDPAKYTGRWSMGACVWDWFTPAIKSQVFAMLNGDKTSCGTHGQDVANSLSGVWLAVGKRSQAPLEDLHIALVASHKNDGTYRFSIGLNSGIPSLPGGIYEFRAEASGLRNPTFASVGPGQVACFDGFDPMGRASTAVTRIFATMSAGATERLTIAGDSGGACGQGPYSMPSAAVTFERLTKTSG